MRWSVFRCQRKISSKRQNNVIDIVKDEKNCYTQTAWVGHIQSRKGVWLFMLKEKAIKVSGKLMEKFVKKEETKWPPHCVGIFHQPKRPANKTKDN